MSRDSDSESDHSSQASSAQSDAGGQTPKQGSGSKKKSSKSSKPRLTASQKNTNHKDAENKRRNAIRERFTDLSRMVPGAEGLERSEQVMLGKTTEYLREILEQQRNLELIAQQRGIVLDEKDKIRDDDYGGPNWQQPNLDAYNATKVKKQPNDGSNEQGRNDSDA